VLLAAFFTLVGGIALHKSESLTVALLIWGIGFLLVLVYSLVPGHRRTIYLSWLYAAYPLALTISHLWMGVIYYLMITPIGLMMRLFGYDPMGRKFDHLAKSYWVKHDSSSKAARYFRQF